MKILSIQFSSVTESYPTLRDPVEFSTPGFPVHHQLLELAQAHFHWIGDAIQTSHPLSSPSPPVFSQSFPASRSFPMSQFLASGGQSIEMSALASVLPVNTQGWFPFRLTVLIALQSKGLSRVFSTPQFKSINSSAFSFLYGQTLISIHNYWKSHSFD